MVFAGQVRRGGRWVQAGGLTLTQGATLMAGATGAAVATESEDPDGQQNQEATSYIGNVEVVREVGVQSHSGSEILQGTVFEDEDLDSHSDRNEDGVAGVPVSNGREVVITDDDGGYELSAYEGMTDFVTKPSGWEVPLDQQNFPQFFYHHLPEGSPPRCASTGCHPQARFPRPPTSRWCSPVVPTKTASTAR